MAPPPKDKQVPLFTVNWPSNPPAEMASHPAKRASAKKKNPLTKGGKASRSRQLPQSPENACSISQLNQRLKGLVEEGLHGIYVLGELRDVKQAPSGHWYFSLCDERASMRCILFRGAALGMPFLPENGLRVLVYGNMSVYALRGECQMQVVTLALQGAGEHQHMLEKRKKKLEQEGLFATERKRPLPSLPCGVGVVTSVHGAALHDILNVIGRRFSSMPVILCPVAVQGLTASVDIAHGIDTLNQHATQWGLDVLIVSRGGGAREDLDAFDSEEVVRAVAASQLPVISAVGHETDVTLIDFAADVRAPTPSAAAELAVPVRTDLLENIARSMDNLCRQMHHIQHVAHSQWQRILPRLHAPQGKITHLQTRFQQNHARLKPLGEQIYTSTAQRVQTLLHRLSQVSPQGLPAQYEARVYQYQLALQHALQHRLRAQHQRVDQGLHALQNMGPLKVLARGYAALQSLEGKRIVSAKQVRQGQSISLLLHNGSLEATVTKRHLTGKP